MCVDLKGWKGLGKEGVCGCVVTRFQCYVYTTGFEACVALRVPTVVCLSPCLSFVCLQILHSCCTPVSISVSMAVCVCIFAVCA